MSGDHNQNQTDSGWRKRQIALDIKAENARELGLDYEPDKIIEMAREVGLRSAVLLHMYGKEAALCDSEIEELRQLERFAELVRAEERDRAMRENAYVLAEREACAYRAGIALLGADRGLANRVDQAIRRGQA
jgi:hypothetical protein